MSKTGFYDANAKRQFVDDLTVRFGQTVTRSQVLELASEKAFPIPYWFLNDKSRNVGRGSYSTTASVTKPSNREKLGPVTLDPSMFANTPG